MNQEQKTVNLEAHLEENPEIKKALEQSNQQLFFIPFMTPDKFAQAIGVTKAVVKGWMHERYIPTAKIGRYRMINMVVLVSNLKQGRVL